ISAPGHDELPTQPGDCLPPPVRCSSSRHCRVAGSCCSHEPWCVMTPIVCVMVKLLVMAPLAPAGGSDIGPPLTARETLLLWEPVGCLVASQLGHVGSAWTRSLPGDILASC